MTQHAGAAPVVVGHAPENPQRTLGFLAELLLLGALYQKETFVRQRNT